MDALLITSVEALEGLSRQPARAVSRAHSLEVRLPEGARAPLELSTLRRLTRVESIVLQGVALSDLSALAELPALKWLELRGCSLPPDLRGLHGFTGVLRLEGDAYALGALEGLQASELTLSGRPEADLDELPLLAGLMCLILRGWPALRHVDGLGRLSALTFLRLHALPALEDVRGVGELGALRRAWVSEAPALRGLTGLGAAPALRSLSLHDLPALESLAGLEGAAGLEDFTLKRLAGLKTLRGLPSGATLDDFYLEDLPALESFRGLPAHPSRSELRSRGLTGLRSLDGLEACANMQMLFMGEVEAPLDVSALARMPTLWLADFRGSKGLVDVGVLSEMPSPPVLLLHGTGVTRRSVPQTVRWRCSWGRDPNTRPLRERQPPPRAPQPKRFSVTETRALLLSGTPEVAMERLAELGDPDAYGRVLNGVKLSECSSDSPYGYPSWRLKHGAFPRPNGPDAIHRVLAAAPQGTELAKLRSKITRLDFFTPGSGEEGPLCLDSLAALRRLKKLYVFRMGPLTASDGLVLRALTDLAIWRSRRRVPTAWLANCPKLKRVQLVKNGGGDPAMGWVADAPQLEALWLAGGRFKHLSPLAGHPGLQRLRVQGTHQMTDLDALQSMPAVTHLELLECRGLTQLDALARWPALEEVHLRRHMPPNLEGLVVAPALKKLVYSNPLKLPPSAEAELEARGVVLERRPLHKWPEYA